MPPHIRPQLPVRPARVPLLIRTTLALFPHQLRFLTHCNDHPVAQEIQAIRVDYQSRLNLTSTPSRRYPSMSPLFALSQLSNARESQSLAKASRLSRIEHSPSLQLIRSSEVDQLPFVTTSNSVKETQERKAKALEEWKKFKTGRGRRSMRNMGAEREWMMLRAGDGQESIQNPEAETTENSRNSRLWGSSGATPHLKTLDGPNFRQHDTQVATAVGRAVLASQHKRETRLKRQLAVAQRQHSREASVWSDEKHKFERERRSGAIIVLLAAIAGTGALAWRLGDDRSGNLMTPIEQWQRKWEMKETEALRKAMDASLMANRLQNLQQATQWVCHEDGCGSPEFFSDHAFMQHYWRQHPQLMTHLSQDGRFQDLQAVQWICHEEGCAEAEFSSDDAFMQHYWQRHPQLMTHLPWHRLSNNHTASAKIGGWSNWFWS